MTLCPITELAASARVLMRGSRVRWWLVGGVALSVSAGRCWRDHEDIDIATLNRNLLDTHLRRLQETGVLLAVDGHRRYVSARFERRLTVEFVLSAGDATCWIYRRNPALRVEWSEAVLYSADGVPYLAPELVLLGKSHSRRPHDETDALEVIPMLRPDRRMFLAELLDPDHPWRGLLSS